MKNSSHRLSLTSKDSIHFALVLFFAATGIATAEMRTWNLKSGATLEAEIVSFPTPKTVQIKRSDGKVYTLQESYLSDDDQAYLEGERQKQWKEVSVDKILATVSGGRYKKCSVSGKEVPGQILVTMLPAQIEPILTKRQQQENQITALNDRIQSDDTTSHQSANGGSRAARNAAKTAAKTASQDETSSKTNLTKLKADYDDYVKKTKPTTTLMMKNTGVAYEGLQIWECQKAQ